MHWVNESFFSLSKNKTDCLSKSMLLKLGCHPPAHLKKQSRVFVQSGILLETNWPVRRQASKRPIFGLYLFVLQKKHRAIELRYRREQELMLSAMHSYGMSVTRAHLTRPSPQQASSFLAKERNAVCRYSLITWLYLSH